MWLHGADRPDSGSGTQVLQLVASLVGTTEFEISRVESVRVNEHAVSELVAQFMRELVLTREIEYSVCRAIIREKSWTAPATMQK